MRMRTDSIQPPSDFELCTQLIIQVWQPTAAISTLSFVFFLSSHLSAAAQSRLLTSAWPFLLSLPLSAVLAL